MLDNASTLSDQGMFVSAETMLNQNTLPHLENIHKEIVNDMSVVVMKFILCIQQILQVNSMYYH